MDYIDSMDDDGDECLEGLLGSHLDDTMLDIEEHEIDYKEQVSVRSSLSRRSPTSSIERLRSLQASPSTALIRISKIPKNVEIIDVDNFEFGSHYQYSDDEMSSSPIVKVEAPDTIAELECSLLEGDEQPKIKEEPIEFVWRNTLDDAMTVSDSSDDEEEANLRQGAQEPIVKAEPFDWVWTNRLEDAVRISNSSEDEREVVLSGEDGSTTKTPRLQRVLLCNPKKMKGLSAAEQRAQIEILQKKVIERASGKSIGTGAGNIFKGLQGTVKGASLANSNRNEHAWMEEISSGSDDDGARLRAEKKEYRRKLKKGPISMEAEVALMKAVKRTDLRLKWQKKAKAREEENNTVQKELEASRTQADGDDEEESTLFLPEDTPVPSSNKRPYSQTMHDSGNVDLEEADFLAHQRLVTEGGKRSRYGAVKSSGRNPVTTKVANEAIMNAINAELERDKKIEAAKARALKKSTTAKKKERTVRPRAKKRGQKGKDADSRRGPEMTNLDNLLDQDVIADAQANEGLASQPTFKERNKALALKELVASVPEDSRRLASVDKRALLEATKNFVGRGRGTMQADGQGGWRLKGMTTSLYNYQLLGAAFMRKREEQGDRPLGGICADGMGLGKTVMMIANILDSRPHDDEPIKTTLVVAPSSLITQWMEMIKKHCEPRAMGEVIRYHAGSRITTTDTVESLRRFNVILTTYSEVSKSWPMAKPPSDCVTPEEKKQWRKDYVEKNRGPLHRIMFHRVVLDEATAIKNHLSRTSIACCSLMARHRWAMSGTPIQNRVEEFFPYFVFLKVKHTGNIDIFKHNFWDKGSNIAKERLDEYLRMFMLRRTHLQKIFGVPILKLPPSRQHTTIVDFSPLERAIYEIVRRRFIERINRYSKSGTLYERHCHIFSLALRLRQLTGHIFMIQNTIEELLEKEDVEKLMRLTRRGPSENTLDDKILVQLRKLLTTSMDESNADVGPDTSSVNDEVDTGKEFGKIAVNFKKYLRNLRKGAKWAELEQRSLCPHCRQPAEIPHVTSCNHVYCLECLHTLQYEAAKNNQDGAMCLECGEIFNDVSPCEGIEELEDQDTPRSHDSPSTETNRKSQKQKKKKSGKKEDDPMRWIDLGDHLLPSAKTIAIKAQILNWIHEAPNQKIIIFTQFLYMMSLLGRIFEKEGWGYCEYSGKMSLAARDEIIDVFAKDKSKLIMIASLKTGGVGLNLTMASRVVSIDLWWNSSVENQAFCRVFRIGQDSETCLRRFVVRNTIDEKLIDMQERKNETINRAMGDDGSARDYISVSELIRLFGKVKTGLDGKEFIWVDEADEASLNDPDLSGGD